MSYSISDAGTEPITAFYFPGEIFGLDGINKNKHPNSAKALETAAIRDIPFELLGELSSRIPSLQRHFFSNHEPGDHRGSAMITMRSKNSAEQHVAALLLSISVRYARRILSATAFRLAMSRADIENYLGLVVETVNHIFTRLQNNSILHAER